MKLLLFVLCGVTNEGAVKLELGLPLIGAPSATPYESLAGELGLLLPLIGGARATP